MREAGDGWVLVVPLKPLRLAKSRLAAAAGDELRPALALAFALDTVAAALRCPAVAGVLVVTEDPAAGERLRGLGGPPGGTGVPEGRVAVLPDGPGRGLNAAVTHGVRAVRAGAGPSGARGGRAPVAALNADLPALRPEELARVLGAAAGHARSFLADAAGSGTTLLAVAPGTEPAPAFGPHSRARHLASGAVELAPPGVAGARQDVDTGDDLRAALALGAGPHTTAAVCGHGGEAFGAFRRCGASRG
ncbi:2-phospho-L-lactate guanylyltransferase [Streptomyces aidingensis]|uniref:2-phospho-L-lactate guanylyltransferase n=1 Tax=Streptomyces aidingensis TaxID=910347 RepID=UPI001FE94B45|nr:2-phospho-L-lactate guanylyltransferase [Streptomyces aidingensis]